MVWMSTDGLGRWSKFMLGVFIFQGHSVLRGLLSLIRPCQPAGQDIGGRESSFLLVLYFRLCSRMYSGCSSQPLWWWACLPYFLFVETVFALRSLNLIPFYPVVKTRLQSLNKSANEDSYNGVTDCIRYSIRRSDGIESVWFLSMNVNGILIFLQEDRAEGGTNGVPEGGGLQGSCHRSALRDRSSGLLHRCWRVPLRTNPIQPLLCLNTFEL